MNQFHLEPAIALWRGSLSHNRTFSNEDLDELECHIRDQVRALVSEGATEEDAFKRAIREMGHVSNVESEYEKVYWGKIKRNQGFLSEILWGILMIKNYWTIAVRTIRKHKSSSFISISGLALGMACCIVVMLFIRDETSYDSYHTFQNRLYRISTNSVEMSSGDSTPSANSPILWAPAMQRDYPEVESYTRFVKLPSAENPWQLAVGENEFFEEDILYADSTVFSLFSWPLLRGDVSTALSEEPSIILTEEMAAKYFGKEDPLGRSIIIDPRLRDREGALTGQTFEYTVTGVLKDIPRRSHFTFDFLLPAVGLNTIYGGDINSGNGINSWFWRGRIAYTYVLLQKGASPDVFESKFDDFLDRYVGDATRSRGYYYEPFLQRIDQIYLDGNMQSQLQVVGDLNNLYMFSIIAFFILCIACINFMNLSTARSSERFKEVGLRKVVGANRKQLITQFMGEAILTSFIAFFFALLLALVMLPLFYSYLDKTWVFDFGADAPYFISLLLLGTLVGLLAGSYPAFFLSRYRPGQVLKGIQVKGFAGSTLRSSLIVFQFAISTFLIIATLTVFNQLEFMRSHELGFDQERVVVLPPNTAQSLASHYDILQQELNANPMIKQVTMSSAVPGFGGSGDTYVAQGRPPEEGFGLGEILTDFHYIEMFGLEMIAGREFSEEYISDFGRQEDGRFVEVAAIINEEAVRRFGWDSPEEAIGQKIIRDPHAGDWTANIVGVVKDFHFEHLREPIIPWGIMILPNYRYMAIKLQTGNTTDALRAIESTVTPFLGESTFDYTFLDDAFLGQYREEQRLGEVFGYISLLAVIIACLGLLGLAAFTTEKRTKEIGIRKALGASIPNIVFLLSKGVIRLVLVAVVVAIPIAYIVTERWLELFAYRIGFNPFTFVLAALLALAVAVFTISFQTFKAASKSPTTSLRYE